MTDAQSDDRRWLQEQLDDLFAQSAESLVELSIDEDPTWSIVATLSINNGPEVQLTGAGDTARAAYVEFLANAMDTASTTLGLIRRGNAACWVCASERARTDMEAELVGGEIWWLCDRCQRRRSNAERLNLIWPTLFETWIRRWRADQRTAGRDELWMKRVETEAAKRYEVDPFLRNKMDAVLKVAAEG